MQAGPWWRPGVSPLDSPAKLVEMIKWAGQAAVEQTLKVMRDAHLHAKGDASYWTQLRIVRVPGEAGGGALVRLKCRACSAILTGTPQSEAKRHACLSAYTTPAAP